jgi:hypothetical protein
MEVEEIYETLVFDTTPTWLIAREDLSTSVRRGRLEILTHEEYYCLLVCIAV